MGVGGQRHALAALTPGSRHIRGGFVGTTADQDRCGKLSSTRILSPDRPVYSELLYRLSFPGPHNPSHTTYILHRYEQLATDATERRGRRCKQLLDDLVEKRG